MAPARPPLHPRDSLKKLVFITPDQGAHKLSSKYAREVINLAAKLGIEVTVVGI